MKNRMSVSRCCCDVVVSPWIDIPFPPNPHGSIMEQGANIAESFTTNELTTWDNSGATRGIGPVFNLPDTLPVTSNLEFRLRFQLATYVDPGGFIWPVSRPAATPGTSSGPITVKLHMWRGDYSTYTTIGGLPYLDVAASSGQFVTWTGVGGAPDEGADFYISPNLAAIYLAIVGLPAGPGADPPDVFVALESTTVELTESVWNWLSTSANGAMYRT